jgi:NAD(P)-dependent dehydrogenase (short-subunit alcohol dehydrogenase family)
MLDGIVCIVTGASEGIGEAIAKALALDTGAKVVLAARQFARLEQNAQNLIVLGASAERLMAVKCDIIQSEDVRNLVDGTIGRYKKIDVLINCAGLMYYSMASKGYTEASNDIDIMNIN